MHLYFYIFSGEVPSIDEFNRKPLDPNSETWRQRIFRFCEGDGTLGIFVIELISKNFNTKYNKLNVKNLPKLKFSKFLLTSIR